MRIMEKYSREENKMFRLSMRDGIGQRWQLVRHRYINWYINGPWM